ncbi:MAG: hypothetical protein M3083_03990 [Actinomycetota bacterium]|nr:hypothetical protein [Actinomycetota bacterium]
MARNLEVLADSPADYERLGLSPTSIAPVGGRPRTDNSADTCEWWYFDAHLADEAKLVVTFMNEGLGEPQHPLSPLLRLNLDLPDGRHFEKIGHYPPTAWSAAKDHADVHIAQNRFTGDLHRYRIEATVEEISVHVNLTGRFPPWRPSTGYMLFGADERWNSPGFPRFPGRSTGSCTNKLVARKRETRSWKAISTGIRPG